MPKYSLEDIKRYKAEEGLWNRIKNAFNQGLEYAIAQQAKPQEVATTYSTVSSNNSNEKERKDVAKSVINETNKVASNVSNVVGDVITRFMTAPQVGTATTAYTFPQYQFSNEDRQHFTEAIAPVANTISPSQWGGVLVDAVTGQEINMPWSGKQTGIFGNSGIGQMLNLALDFYAGGKGIKGGRQLNNAIHSLKGDNIYFIRNVGDIPEVNANGMFYSSPKRNALSNFTWDQSFRTHKRYLYRPGSEYMIFPSKLMKGKRFMSTDPMDTFIANDQFPANQVTIVSGNPEQLSLAKQRGFKTYTSEELQGMFRDSKHKRTPGEISLDKDFRIDPYIAKEYDALVNKMIRDKFGRLSILDAKGLKYRSGIDPHLKSKSKLDYDPATSIEDRLGKQYGFPQRPSIESLPTFRIQEILDELGSKYY